MARTDNGQKAPTKGGQLLTRLAPHERAVAERLGVSNGLVHKWVDGTRTPTDERALQLREAYGIPVTAWAEPPEPPSVTSAHSTSDRMPEPEGIDATMASNARRLNQVILRDLESLEGPLGDALEPGRRAEAIKKLADAQVALSRVTGESAITIDRIRKHPDFLRATAAIARAVAPWPEALAAAHAELNAELKRIEGGR